LKGPDVGTFSLSDIISNGLVTHRFELRLQGQPIGLFATIDEAKARAQAGADSARAMKAEDGEYFGGTGVRDAAE
jgi:hypothetical protein